MNKKILFFDGDGTLWYPSKTKREEKPFWIYSHDNYLELLELCPGVDKTLEALKSDEKILVLLSTHPDSLSNADQVLKNKVANFDLEKYFDEINVSPEYPEAKGEVILKILDKYSLNKQDALMIGDSFRWDYQSAMSVGVDAVLIDSKYHQEKFNREPVDLLISELPDLLKLTID